METVSLYTNGPFTDLCRGPHAPSTKRVKAFKLLSVAGAYWRGDAGRQMLTRIYGTAFHSKEDLDAVPAAARGGAGARPPAARPRPRPLHVQRAEPRLAVLAPRRHGDAQPADDAVAGGERRARIPRGQDADPLRRRPLEAVRPLGRLPRQHVLHGRPRGPSDGPEADELPGPRPALQGRAPLLPRPADPLLGGRPRAPPRAERHAPRPAARPPHHAGRRPHLLHRGAGPGGGPALPGLRLRDLRHVRLPAAAGALHPAGEARRHRGDVGPRRGAAREGARRQGPRVRAQRRRRRVLRPEDRPPHDRLDRPLVAARHRAARLLHAGAVRAHLHRRRQRRAPAGDDPSRADGQLRALHGDPDRALRRRVPALARAGPGRRAAARRPPRRLRARGPGGAHRGRAARRGRRPHGVGRAQDPRGRAAQDPLHARGRRPRGRADARSRCAATARATRGRCRCRRRSRGWPRSPRRGPSRW